MRRTRFVWTAVAVLVVACSTTIIRGDQPLQGGKGRFRGRPPASDDPSDDERMSAMGRLARLSATGRLDQALERARRRHRGLVTATHVQDFLDSAVGGEEDDAEDGPAGGQAETSIAVDGTGRHIVVGFNDMRGLAENPVSVSGFMYSDDGGATFTDGGRLPTPGTDLIGTTRYPQVFGDPEVKYLGGSTFIYFSIMVRRITVLVHGVPTFGTAQTMCVHRSMDNGHTWQGPFEIPAATNPNGLFSGANARDAADKEFAAVDPDSGRAMLSWSNFTSTAIAPGGVEISTTFSDDIATATPPTWSTRRVVAKTSAEGQASQPYFAGNGSSNGYVVWRRFPGGFNQNVGFARSIDNGQTWGAPINLTSNFLTSDEILGNDRTNTSPSIAVDNSTGPNMRNVYVVYANNNNKDGADIVVQRSLDGGLTFSAPIAIDSRPGADRAQWFPWVTVDTTTGRVHVFYYDQGIAASGDLTETTVQYSDDGGLSWSKPMPLTDRPFHAAYGNDTGQPNLGDYNQAVAQNGELFAAWAGTAPVGFTDGQPTSSSMTTPDVVFKRTPASHTKISVSLLPFTIGFDDHGNGSIDPGDLVGFTIPLTNYVNNPINAATVDSVQATLSTSTPGVSVVGAIQTYPDLAPGTTASNASAFVVQIDQAFVPGTHVEFSLAVSSAQGSVVLLFTQSTGTPMTTKLLFENFDGVAPGALPAGWLTSHAGGSNTVPWKTSNTFMGTGSNAAFHANANDGLGGANTRFERLSSPLFAVPADAEYVTLDFDVAYNTEDEPTFNVWAYDGFLLRITDRTAGNVFRAVQAEAFAEEFTTGTSQFYPKKMGRNSSTAYLQDLAAWAGTSNGVKHVHMKLPGMAGTTAQLNWEYTQDSAGICTDVRPGPCGVAFDNIAVQSVVSSGTVTTSTSVASSQNPSDSEEPVTFTASVTAGSAVTAGVVTFSEGATILAADVPVGAGGHASFTTSSLTPGAHTIMADYSGMPHFASSSGSVVQKVDPIPTFTIDDVSVTEGNAGTSIAVFTVTLSSATHAATAQVDFATADGTATTAGNDYVSSAGTLSFAPGETSHTIGVAVNGDRVFEPDETFVVDLSNASHATIADGEGAGTIRNDDAMPTIAVDDVSVVEGDAGTTSAVFTVSLSNPSSGSVSVAFTTADGTATTSNNDYVGAAGTITFAPHETTKTVSVSVQGDHVIEPNETFFVNLLNPSGATISDGQGVGTIRNDDTVATTFAALVAQATDCSGGSTSGRCQALLAQLATVQREIAAGRTAGVVKALELFVKLLETFNRPIPRNGRPPPIDAATVAVWVAEAQSIIAALMTT